MTDANAALSPSLSLNPNGRLPLKGPYCSRISGTGHYLPPKVLTNADLEKMVDTNDAWIVERTGIKRRHIAEDGVGATDLALEASRIALETAGLTAADLDCIIFATVSSDQPTPNSACVLQSKLGARKIASFDIGAACTGFVYALSMADSLIRVGLFKHILVVGSEVLHPFVNYKDRETCILFGDGAGAFVLSRADSATTDSQIHSMHLRADGDLGSLFWLKAGGSIHAFKPEALAQGYQYLAMKGREIFKHAVRTMSEVCQEAIEANGLTTEQINWLIPHQANLRIIDAVGKHFEFPSEKVIVTVDETGNTSAASVPIAFDTAVRDGRIQRGQKVLLTAFGSGLTSGSLLLTY